MKWYFSLLIFSALIIPSFSKDQLFVARHVHPLTITAEGTQLLALDSESNQLSIFATGAAPVLIHEIKVGLVPVSVRLRTEDEAWVVNELSDSISVVSLSRGAVIKTISTGDEPGDVAFANGKAFVTCSRDNRLDVFNASNGQKIDEIPLEGLFPRSLTVSADEQKIYVSFLHTSNGTTVLPKDKAPAQTVPDWVNPELPTPPQTSQIVPVDHEEILYEVVDHDVAVVSSDDSQPIVYRGGLGTNIFNLSLLPDGRLLVPNSEARNQILFEPQLRGRFAQTRLSILDETSHEHFDLNSDPDPSFPEMDESSKASALAQVKVALPNSAGSHVWLAAFGSDRIVRMQLSDQAITDSIDLRGDDPGEVRSGLSVRGPRGLALHPTLPHLYVLNKLSRTLALINHETSEIISEAALGSGKGIAQDLKIGRGILFDARLSGNGTVSCASCHIDLERDGMAWDLGDPSGEMLTVQGAFLSLHLPNTFAGRVMHPMKGPMVTQTLIGLSEQTKLHWRGDKPTIQSFNSTFPNLLGGSKISDLQMDMVAAYLQQLRHHPNPHLLLDRNLPAEIDGGNPTDGIAVYTLFDNHCSACHSLPSGTSNNIDVPSTVGSFQPLKDAPLRTTYHRLHLNPAEGARSLSGFGMGSDGSLHELPIGHPYSLHILDDIDRPLEVREKEKRDLSAFILAFDTGTAPAMGKSLTFSTDQDNKESQLTQLAILEAQSSLGDFSEVTVIAHGIWNGTRRSFHFDPDNATYLSDQIGETPLSANDLIDSLGTDDVLTFMAVPVGMGELLSTDRNENGIPDRSERPPALQILPNKNLRWSLDANDWYPGIFNQLHQLAPSDITSSAVR